MSVNCVIVKYHNAFLQTLFMSTLKGFEFFFISLHYGGNHRELYCDPKKIMYILASNLVVNNYVLKDKKRLIV